MDRPTDRCIFIPHPTPPASHVPSPPKLLPPRKSVRDWTTTEYGVSQPATWRRYPNRSDGAGEDAAQEAGSAAAPDADISRNPGGGSVRPTASAAEAKGEGLRHFRQNGFGDTVPHARVFSFPQVTCHMMQTPPVQVDWFVAISEFCQVSSLAAATSLVATCMRRFDVNQLDLRLCSAACLPDGFLLDGAQPLKNTHPHRPMVRKITWQLKNFRSTCLGKYAHVFHAYVGCFRVPRRVKSICTQHVDSANGLKSWQGKKSILMRAAAVLLGCYCYPSGRYWQGSTTVGGSTALQQHCLTLWLPRS